MKNPSPINLNRRKKQIWNRLHADIRTLTFLVLHRDFKLAITVTWLSWFQGSIHPLFVKWCGHASVYARALSRSCNLHCFNINVCHYSPGNIEVFCFISSHLGGAIVRFENVRSWDRSQVRSKPKNILVFHTHMRSIKK
jgi:hypothetical protein